MSHGGNKRNFQTFSPVEFIAAVTQHIPDRLAQMVRYVGWYSNRMRGDRSKAEKLKEEGEQKKVAENEIIDVRDSEVTYLPF